MKNWRRDAALKAMPLLEAHQPRTPWLEFRQRFQQQPVAMGAAVFILLLLILAAIGPWVSPYDAENFLIMTASIRDRLWCTGSVSMLWDGISLAVYWPVPVYHCWRECSRSRLAR